MQNSTEETFSLTVNSQRFIQQIPALFVSPTDAASEIIQNAYRAGATQLVVRVRSADQTVEFTDNGPGLVDREHLFSVATSGWDTERVIDAAGIGALALFSLSESVHVESVPEAPHTAWSAEFSADIFQGGLIQYRTELRGNRPCGLTITARLKSDVKLPNLTTSSWRHQFPLAVTVQVDDAPPQVVPPVMIDGLAIDTPVGTIRVQNVKGKVPVEAVWEHRLVNCDRRRVERLIRQALSESLAGHVVKELLKHEILTWYIVPASGVRPKLPDRRELIENAALTDAVRVIASTLEAEIDISALQESARVLAATPVIDEDVADKRLPAEHCGRLAPLGGVMLRLVLPYLGYKCCNAPLYSSEIEWYIDDTDTELHVEATTTKVWVIPSYRAASLSVEAAAVAAGIPALVSADASLPLLRFTCDRWTASPALSCVFAQGLRIVVDAAHDVPNSIDAVADTTVSHVIDDADFGDVLAGFAPDVEAAMRQVFSVTGSVDGQSVADDPTVLYPVQTSDLVEYILSNPAFESQLVLVCYHNNSEPFNIWDYVRWVDRSLDTDMLVRDAADLFATERGGDLTQRVLRESQAYRLDRAVRESLLEVKARLDPSLLQAARDVSLSPSAIDRIEQMMEHISMQLGTITLKTLLAQQ